jgi:hypothetical protein
LFFAEQQNIVGDSASAWESYGLAETEAVESGATMFAVAAATGSAMMAHTLGDRPGTAMQIRSAIRYSETIRGAVASGRARRYIADTVRAQYEHAVLLAVEIGDGPLAMELAERLRTDRLAGLLRRSAADLPVQVAGLLAEIARVGAAVAERDPSRRGASAPPRPSTASVTSTTSTTSTTRARPSCNGGWTGSTPGSASRPVTCSPTSTAPSRSGWTGWPTYGSTSSSRYPCSR